MAQKKGRRYDVSRLTENQYQPGSRGRVLRNLLAITSKREMDLAEAEALKRATDTLVGVTIFITDLPQETFVECT
jgi:hypothetical protein